MVLQGHWLRLLRENRQNLYCLFHPDLVADGRLVKVGLKGGEEKPVAEVNAFQIRYRLPVVATEEVVEEAK